MLSSQESQQILMERVFMNLTPEEEEYIKGTQREACGDGQSWRYVQCEGSLVISVGILYHQMSPINIKYFPPTMKMIIICGCGQKFPLNVRIFPREATHIDLASNQIFGRVELSQLPKNTRYFNVSENRLRGPIDFRALPEHMREINLSANRIEQAVVYYSHLPEHIRRIDVRKNAIGRIQPEHPHDAVERREIFHRMEKKVQ